MKELHSLQVILKVAERCNIACDYCYYFFGGDESYRKRPPYISLETVDALIRFLEEGASDLALSRIDVVFHGGEPLMIGVAKFREICSMLRNRLGGLTSLSLGVQTNGMLVTDAWLEAFEDFGVSVGVSLDGDREVNDAHRVDKRGRGTYTRSVGGLEKITRATANGSGVRASLLTVLNTTVDQERTLDHFTRELNVRDVGILLPDCSVETGLPEGTDPAAVGTALAQIVDYAFANPGVKIREVQNLVDMFQIYKPSASRAEGGSESAPEGDAEDDRVYNQIIVVQSDGALSIDDSYMPTEEWRKSAPVGNLASISLKDWLSQPVYVEARSALKSLPGGCRTCVWSGICSGGDLENRYSSASRFDNPSVYCSSLKSMYTALVMNLVKSGYPKQLIVERLLSNKGEQVPDLALESAS